jgi:hypothetical protein
MVTQTKDWQASLQTWLQIHPKTIPDHLRQLREAFVQRFPIESLEDMMLDQYAVGKPDSFCYWLEFKTKELGSISGGSAAKFGVWWSKSEERWRWNSMYHDEEDALNHIKRGLLALIDATRAGHFDALDKIGRELLEAKRYSLRSKPLYIYFPDYFLPISNLEHLKYFLSQFGKNPKGDLITLNRQLLSFLRSLPQFEGFDTMQMMVFLYENMPPVKKEDTAPTEMRPLNVRQTEEIVVVASPISNHAKVFISYSHDDKEDLDRLLVHLRAAKLNSTVEWWDDTQIKPGEKWDNEVKKAIASARVAILLVSVNYLSSEFILKNELPSLLRASEQEGVTILPVILGPCIFQHTNLAHFQAVNDPATPLSNMSKHEKDAVWNKVVETILSSDSF